MIASKFKRWLAGAAALSCLIGVVPTVDAASADKLPFDDIAGSFAKDAIIRLYDKQLLSGTSARTFSPKQPVTRAEFITILDRVLGIKPVHSAISPFKDMTASAWYYDAITAAVQIGLVDGTGVHTFEPSKPVTRQEAASMLVRAFKQSNVTGSTWDYADAGEIAAWADTAVGAVRTLGLMTGDSNNNFNPADGLTRQETAAVIDRALQNAKWASALAKPQNAARVQFGWQYGQTAAQYEQSVVQAKVTTLSPRWYFFDPAGGVSDYTDQSLVNWASKNKRQIWAMVGNRSSQEVTHQNLSNATYRGKVVDRLASYVQKYGLKGLNIDFENVAPGDRAYMTAFISELSTRLHKLGAVVSVCVSPDLGSDWTEGFDYQALGASADYIVMMAYDEHWSTSPKAGSVASMPYVNNAVNTLLQVVPANKVILALPYYNRDWAIQNNGTVTATELTLIEQNNLIRKYSLTPTWDASVGQYTVTYQLNGLKHQIWIEDGRSLAAKYKTAMDHDLAGLAYWYMGGASPDVYASLSNAERFYGLNFN
ncbi:S-layer homology domain-containing protein [Paenibacillus glycanilyticus]|uniref:S-layer homology domain-containing protein n=1 Tax=Paenibacillus glycanilyticus TaxID=126569 RepID=UPI00203A921F|nr:S-layer homology domain-containing protein [Paenibacillus glycanilyticus]MCM3630691.1 S-layer homology domain-containing protein [Paenibacillus glycanilyticus]